MKILNFIVLSILCISLSGCYVHNGRAHTRSSVGIYGSYEIGDGPYYRHRVIHHPVAHRPVIIHRPVVAPRKHGIADRRIYSHNHPPHLHRKNDENFSRKIHSERKHREIHRKFERPYYRKHR